MKSSARVWIPGFVLVVAVAILLIAMALNSHSSTQGLPPGADTSPTPEASQAVEAAVMRYYQVAADARRSGRADLIDGATTGPASLASVNFKNFVAEQAAKGRRSMVLQNHFADWQILIDRDIATAHFNFWLTGHDIDLQSGRSLEGDMDTPTTSKVVQLALVGGSWLVATENLIAASPG